MDSWAFSGELVHLPLIGGGKTILMSILLISPVADLLFGMQECRFQDAGMILFSSGDRILTHLP
jgi:hypothetical protein